uniref:DB domain-containing protein n=1 Tax=Elaeophora elaphi TaxID=1147741 RepID=A0A0R3RXT4_9BILA
MTILLLLLSYRISYACIGLGGRGFHECSDLDHFCAEARLNNESDGFLKCCRKRGLPEVCLRKCSYVNYDHNILRRMFLQMDPCPLMSASDIHFCAAQGHDHRQCCAMNGVTTTLAGQKCLIFCDQRMQNETILDASYLPCFERFDNIKGCFWRYAKRRYQLTELSKKSRSRITSGRVAQLSTEQPPSPFDNYR